MVDHDVVIIGAGFSGLYQLHKLRTLGFDATILEAGPEVGGTWYWNRYPGARCDIESIEYSYSFDPELEQEWNWSERYAAQPELLAYIRHVAEKHDLRKDIVFGTRVTALEFGDDSCRWTIRADDGVDRTARFVIAATGCLSVPTQPDIVGVDDFDGDTYWTWNWPEGGVDLTGKRVAVVGTGSSGLQTITAIAPDVAHLNVFQRTPVFAVPAFNRDIDDELAEVKSRYREFRAESKVTRGGAHCADPEPKFFDEYSTDEVITELSRRWTDGGLCYQQSFLDLVQDPSVNKAAADFVADRIRDKVNDPVLAEKLIPTTYPIATKRMCVDTGYFEVYNQDNVTLVDLREDPLHRVTAQGIVAGNTEHEFDVIIFATGFDAMTGALQAIDIRHGEVTLREKWSEGPRTYLGLMVAGLPNLFTITGPQSPSVLSNMLTSIEQHVDWITDVLEVMRDRGQRRIEPEVQAENGWVDITNDTADMTLFPQAASWYMGANVPGKRQVFLPFVAGVDVYKQICDGVAVADYHGFEITA
ncbi:NAD(P)/FAD-dependent oxidoreductase [Williamsia sp. 1135]|uniref:flavin-containing monooxygenase n=1 Tax=Williamsia sp. 1135 TaxID=1889262 RepID=UPI000A0F95BD|nr:NAD(P)/FAD-dependent oxidoreductase [Williamsia sp. 1135]ORM33834.1 cyclohexanone monooxygenase [Williamsia sp. 1135]